MNAAGIRGNARGNSAAGAKNRGAKSGSAKPRKARQSGTASVAKRQAKQLRGQRTVRELEPIAHLRARELRSYASSAHSSRVTGERVIAKAIIPADGSYLAYSFRVELPGKHLFRSGTRASALEFERVIYDGLKIDVTPSLNTTANGVHAIAFVPDPTLERKSTLGETGGAALPDTLDGLAVLEHFQMRKANQPLSVRVDAIWLHRTCNYNPFKIQGEDEQHPLDLVSPGWWVYIIGGYSNPFTEAAVPPASVQAPTRLVHKYELTFIEPAYVNTKAEELTYKHMASTEPQGTSTALKTFAEAAIARGLAAELSKILGYDTATVKAALDNLKKTSYGHAAHMRDNSYLQPPSIEVVESQFNSPLVASGLQQASLPFYVGRANSTGRHRDVTDVSFGRWQMTMNVAFNAADIGGYSAGAGNGRRLSLSARPWCLAVQTSTPRFPDDYVQAWQVGTVLSRVTIGDPVVTVADMAPDSVYYYDTEDTVNGVVYTFYSYDFGADLRVFGSTANGTAATLEPTVMIRPPQAIVDHSTLNNYTNASNFTAEKCLYYIATGLREGDVIQLSYTLEEFGTVTPALAIADCPILGLDVEILATNSAAQTIRLADYVLN